MIVLTPDSKVRGANMGPTWVLSSPDGPHVGPKNLAIKEALHTMRSRDDPAFMNNGPSTPEDEGASVLCDVLYADNPGPAIRLGRSTTNDTCAGRTLTTGNYSKIRLVHLYLTPYIGSISIGLLLIY